VPPLTNRRALPEIRAGDPLLRRWRPTGPVTLWTPAARDTAGLPAAYRDADVVRWYGVPDPRTDADVHRYLTGTTRSLWARGEEAVFVVAGPVGSVLAREVRA
jgi:hypothetical protein